MTAEWVVWAAAREGAKDLEDRFPGRWNPKRSLHGELRPLVQAAADALALAGWGPDPDTAIVLGIDRYGEASAAAFQAQLRKGDAKALRPSDFLSSLPSTPAATLGLVLGLGGYQATLVGEGEAGERALDQARALIRSGAAPRALVGALTSTDGIALGVAACVGSAEARIGWGKPPSDLLAGLPSGYLLRAAPRFLALVGPVGGGVMSTADQRMQVKRMIVERLHMRMDPNDIADDAPLFGQTGLGLDSVDAIELVEGIKESFGYEFPSEQEARKVLGSLAQLADHLVAQGKLA